MSTLSLNTLEKGELFGDFDNFTSQIDIGDFSILNENILETKFIIPPNTSPQEINATLNQGYCGTAATSSTNIPVDEEFSGTYNFEMLCSQGKGKNCVYSPILRKIYIDMEQRLPLRFKCIPPPLEDDNLWLRTTLVYSDEQHRGEPVQRCHNHMATNNSPPNQNIPLEVLRQVVRCMQPASVYEEINGHMSVIVPLGAPSPGCNYVPLDFQFFCKNSCSSGMNRRPTKLIFTLETNERQVIGRRNLQVRVCSCPKRDKDKEELDMNLPVQRGKKRKLSFAATNPSKRLPPVPPGKKLMVSDRESSDYLLTLRLPSKEMAKEVLHEVYKVLSAKFTLSGNFQYYTPFMDEVKKKINRL